MWKGFCRIYEIYAIRWAELLPDGSRWGAVLHGHNPTTSLKGRSSPLHLSTSPFGSGMPRARREARLWCARGSMFPSGEKCPANLEGRIRWEEKNRHLLHFLCSSSSCARCIGHGPVSCTELMGPSSQRGELGAWGCQHCRDEECDGLQRPVSPH